MGVVCLRYCHDTVTSLFRQRGSMSHNTVQPWKYANSTDQTSTASFALVTFDQGSTRKNEVLTYLPLFAEGAVSFWVKNTGSNSIDWEVLAFPDSTTAIADAVTIQASAAVAAGAVTSKTVDFAHWPYYAVLIRDTGGGSHGTVTARVTQKRA